MNDDDFLSDNFSVNFLVASNHLYENCCGFSNVSVQEKFVDRKLSNKSEELEKGKAWGRKRENSC